MKKYTFFLIGAVSPRLYVIRMWTWVTLQLAASDELMQGVCIFIRSLNLSRKRLLKLQIKGLNKCIVFRENPSNVTGKRKNLVLALYALSILFYTLKYTILFNTLYLYLCSNYKFLLETAGSVIYYTKLLHQIFVIVKCMKNNFKCSLLFSTCCKHYTKM